MHLFGGRRELQQLQDVVLEDHLPRCRGDVLANHELFSIGLADSQLAAAAFEVLGKVLHAAHKALAAGLDHFAQGGGVRGEEIGRGNGVGHHLHEELDPALGHRIDIINARHQIVQPV